MKNQLLGTLLAGFSFFISVSANALEEAPSKLKPDSDFGEAFEFYIENDSRLLAGPGSDQAYSSGFKFSYVYAEDRFPNWSVIPVHNFRLLEQELRQSKVNFAISVGQQIYTPNNTAVPSLVTDDRPYAGWIYIGFAVSLKKENVGHFLELDVGTIGPGAFGKQVQNGVHDLIHKSRSEGWSNSLHDEPTLQVFYQTRFKTFSTQALDIFPYYGAGCGNVLIGAHVGGLIRYGINAPDDFGPSRLSASDGDSFISPTQYMGSNKKRFYVFSGARGNALARNIFLDGNTFQSSHHVTKYPFTFETEFGLGLQVNSLGVVWRFVTKSPEFEQRSIFNSFASMNFIYFL